MKAIISTVTVNGKTYTLKGIDFNAICELEDLGVDLNSARSKSMSLIRALLAYHGNMTPDEAGAEIMSHLQNGGKFDDFAPMADHLGKSDFFRLFSANKETEVTASKDKTEK